MSEISEASLFKEKQCVKVDFSSRSTSSESFASSFTNEIALSPPKEPFQSGDIKIEQSSNVHFGQKTLYENCHFHKVVNYLQDLSDLSKDLKESSESENKPDYFQKSHTGIKNNIKLWIRKDTGKKIIFIGVFLLFIIVLSAVMMISIAVPNSTTYTSTKAPKNKCPRMTKNISTSRINLDSISGFPDFIIINRKKWNASAVKYKRVKLEMPEYVIVSHTLQRTCHSENTCVKRVQTLQNFDLTERNLDDIRYNFLIGGDGNVYEGRGWDVVGQHTDGYNNRSLSIAYIGDFNKKYVSFVQLLAFQWLLSVGDKNKKISEDYKVIGRCQVVLSTDSPGNYLYFSITGLEHWMPDP